MKKWFRNPYLYRKLAYKTYKLPKICNSCNTTKNICIHHVDKNYLNNKKENLQILCTTCHSKLHMALRKNLFWKGKFWKKHNRSKWVTQFTKSLDLVRKFSSIMDVERELWLNHSDISRVCLWKRKTCWWFIWKFN